jgi:hypothetical protein
MKGPTPTLAGYPSDPLGPLAGFVWVQIENKRFIIWLITDKLKVWNLPSAAVSLPDLWNVFCRAKILLSLTVACTPLPL